MHECVEVEGGLLKRSSAELSWTIAAYIEVSIARRRVVKIEVCQHESLKPLGDLEAFATKLSGQSFADELEATSTIWRMISEAYAEWRRDFELIIKPGSLSLTIYM